jgi:hypothetical protein
MSGRNSDIPYNFKALCIGLFSDEHIKRTVKIKYVAGI